MAPHIVPETARAKAVFVGVGTVATAVYLVNLRDGLDFDLDEVMYAIAGQNVAGAASVSWGPQPTAVHPPLHFLLLGAWSLVTGTSRGAVVDALFGARYLGATLSVLTVLLVGLLARRYAAARAPGTRARLIAAAMILATFDGFLVRFGRTALIEPTAIFVGLLVVYLSLRLRDATGPVYVGVVGLASGVALLVKEPLLFTVAVPVLAAVLERDRPQLRRTVAAALIGLLVWGVFPLWAAVNGAGAWWWAEHDTSVRRLTGLLQVSGLNRTGVSATEVFGDTFATYVSGYLIFAIGAVGLVVAAHRGGLFRRRRLGRGTASLVALGTLSYGFLGYCVLLGQANEQLTVYSAVPAVLLSVLAWGNPMPRLAVGACAVAAVVGAVAWAGNVVVARDDATARMGQYLSAQARCAPVNATGNAMRWAPVLPANHVHSFRDGAEAANAGVHLFLLSPKDSRMRYGNSSPELDAWVRGHGNPVREFPSRRYEKIELWSVPGGARAAAEPCGNPRPPAAADASSTRFVVLLLGVMVLVVAVLYGWSIARRRPDWEDA